MKLIQPKLLFSSLFLVVSLSACSSMPHSNKHSGFQVAETGIQAVVLGKTAENNQALSSWMQSQLLMYRGDTAESLPEMARLASELNNALAYKRVISLARQVKDTDVARDMLNKWLLIKPQTKEVHLQALAIELSKLGSKEKKASQAIMRHVFWLIDNDDLAPNKGDELGVESSQQPNNHHHSVQNQNSNAFDLIALMLGQNNNEDVAVDAMQQVLQEHANNTDALAAGSRLYIRYKQDKAARASLQKALSIDPNNSDLIILSSQLDYAEGKKQTALKRLSKAVRKNPDDSKLRLNYADMLVANEVLAKAAYQYEYLLEDTPNNSKLLIKLGSIAVEQKKYKKAEEYYTRLYDTVQDTNMASYYLGLVAEEQELYDKALSHYQSVYGGINYYESRFRAATTYYKLEQIQEARGVLLNLRSGSNDNTKLRSYDIEGRLLRMEKQYQASYDLYTEALAEFPNDTNLLYDRALTSDKLKRIDLIELDLGSILSREPDNSTVLNTYGYALLNFTSRYDEAMVMIERALELEPSSSAILDSYAWGLYLQGHHEKSLGYLRQAYKDLPDPEVAAHLGEVLWVLGKRAEAEKVWDGALKEQPEHETVLETIQRLKTP